MIVVCVFPFIFVIDAALLFLYGIMFFVYAHSLGCHRTHFLAPHSFFYICFSLPIHIWFLLVDCCIMVPVLSYNFCHCWSLCVVVGPYAEPTFSSVLPSGRSFCPARQIIKLNELPFGGKQPFGNVGLLGRSPPHHGQLGLSLAFPPIDVGEENSLWYWRLHM